MLREQHTRRARTRRSNDSEKQDNKNNVIDSLNGEFPTRKRRRVTLNSSAQQIIDFFTQPDLCAPQDYDLLFDPRELLDKETSNELEIRLERIATNTLSIPNEDIPAKEETIFVNMESTLNSKVELSPELTNDNFVDEPTEYKTATNQGAPQSEAILEVPKTDSSNISEELEQPQTSVPSMVNSPISTPLLPESSPKAKSKETLTKEVHEFRAQSQPSEISQTKHLKDYIGADSVSKKTLDEQEEWELLQKLEHSRKPLTAKALRLKRKLHLRRLKRGLDIPIFDIDKTINNYLRSQVRVEGVTKTATAKRKRPSEKLEKDETAITNQKIMQLEKYTCTPLKHSFVRRLNGDPQLSDTLTSFQTWTSPYFGRKLRPYIRRDYESKPPKLRLLEDIVRYPNRFNPSWSSPQSAPIDYCYFQPQHLQQVNECLCRCFWPGIDMSEALLFPDFSIVALYKRMVIGCAFMTPEAYITYIAVDRGWEGSGIGQFMLYHLIQTSIGKDVTLHVFANNPAMILYQKFGFKPEQFFVNFYDKYLPEGSRLCKNAFFMRLRR